ncbi:TIGR01777 family oxidoreductase [Paeniglutamicibacter sp.]|uniref:TIGR01777 family oxidoreductase n=1 Tax=Paeniglutamicibacter sp. TaxID=1934391 RepID=UPI003989B7BC
MAIFEYTTRLPYPRETVFRWFERPGALPRLSAPFAGTIRQEPDKGLAVGSRAVMDVAAPGTLGTSLAAVVGAGAHALGLPGWVRAEIPWHAKHISLNPGHDFTDVMESGPLARWEHQHLFADDGEGPNAGTVMRDVVEFELPVLGRLPGNRAHKFAERAFKHELIQVFRYRERMLRADLSFHASHAAKPLTIAVAGASGMIGTQLCALLGGGGHRIKRLVRDRRAANGADTIFWAPEFAVLDPEELRDVDAVVNLAGHTIGGRFTAGTKEEIRASRVLGTGLLARAMATLAKDGKQRSLIVASAIGIYGANPHGAGSAVPLDEDAAPGIDFLAGVCTAWEDACSPARQAGVRVVNVRTGLVQSPAAGILQRMLPLYALGLGGPLGSEAWQSWISIDDVVGIYAHALLTDALAGPVNAVAPHPVQAKEYAAVLGKVVRRPARVPVPGFGPRLLLGKQGARELAFADQRVSSRKIEDSGYVFRHSDLESALRHVLGHS